MWIGAVFLSGEAKICRNPKGFQRFLTKLGGKNAAETCARNGAEVPEITLERSQSIQGVFKTTKECIFMSEPHVNAVPTAQSKANVKTITSMAMLTAIAYVVMVLSKMLPQVSGFLQLDLKDTVICIGGFIFGPMAAAIISILVAFIEMITISTTVTSITGVL